MSSIAVPLNPFADQIVTQPRRAEPAIKGLNDQVLRRLATEFDKVSTVPRRCGRVQLVVSPAGGYGKSHLTGRLFRELGRRATRVYVRPFTAPDSCWIALLHSMVQELTGPEFEDSTDRGPFPPTQLDAMAHGVFGTLLVGLMDAGEYSYNDPEFVRHRLIKQAFEKWDLSNPASPWGAWAAETLDTFEASETRSARLIKLLEELTQNTLSSATRPQAWLRTLRSFCQDRADAAARELALEWVRARTPRAEEATKPLGLTVSDGEDQTATVAVRNATARSRVLDLLALSKLFRPMVICFDQTEVFGRVPGLPKAFGTVLSDLVQGEGAHLTVVTANQEVWQSQLLPAMESADQDRIAPRSEMLGLTRDQGLDLAQQRLKQTRLPLDLQGQITAPDWVDLQFNSGLLSPREFLRRCERRYEDVVPAAPAQSAKPEMMLVELFAREHKRLIDDPRELEDYRTNVLRWALLDVPTHVSTGVTVHPYGESAVSFVADWKEGDSKRWIIVIEEGAHALNWRTITNRAVTLHKENPNTVTLAIRTSAQPKLPRPHWGMVGPEMEEAERTQALRVVTLTSDQLARVYAAWELYTQACQGDIPHEPDAVVRFAAQRFQSWYATMRGVQSASEKVHIGAPGQILTPLPEAAAVDSSTPESAAVAAAAAPVAPIAPAPTPTPAPAPAPAPAPHRASAASPEEEAESRSVAEFAHAPTAPQPAPAPAIAPSPAPVVAAPVIPPAPTLASTSAPAPSPTPSPAKPPIPAPTPLAKPVVATAPIAQPATGTAPVVVHPATATAPAVPVTMPSPSAPKPIPQPMAATAAPVKPPGAPGPKPVPTPSLAPASKPPMTPPGAAAASSAPKPFPGAPGAPARPPQPAPAGGTAPKPAPAPGAPPTKPMFVRPGTLAPTAGTSRPPQPGPKPVPVPAGAAHSNGTSNGTANGNANGNATPAKPVPQTTPVAVAASPPGAPAGNFSSATRSPFLKPGAPKPNYPAPKVPQPQGVKPNGEK